MKIKAQRKQKGKKEVLLEDLFFDNPNKQLEDIKSELKYYDHVFFRNVFFDIIADASEILEFISRLQKVKAEAYDFKTRLGKYLMYREVVNFLLKSKFDQDALEDSKLELGYGIKPIIKVIDDDAERYVI